jgi:Helix-turn-helix.
MDNNILGERIREARGELSLRDFAKICEISHTHLDSLEKGYDPRTGKKVSIGWDTLKKISAATGLPVLYITGETDDKVNGFIFSQEVFYMADRLGKILTEARGDMSRRAFAKKIGISNTYLDNLENGTDPRNGKPVNVTADTLWKISKATGFTMAYLTGEIDEKEPTTLSRLLENLDGEDIDEVTRYVKSLIERREKQ